jgi:hypothetical protein
VVWGLAAVALWLAATPYQGIIQDARLYALMALHRLQPRAYAADPWFLGGSQDDLSIFSVFYAPLVSALGLERGAMLMTALSGLLFVLAAAILSAALIRGRGRWLALLCLAALPLCYSANDMFQVREGFATGRGLAVPLSMLGVAWAVAGRTKGSLAAHALALAIHPIMALAPAATSMLLLVGPRVRGGLVVAGLAALAAIFLGGQAGAMRLLDGRWFEFVEHSPLIFIAPWVAASLSAILAWFCLLLFAARYGQRHARRVYGSGALVAAIGMAAALLADRIPVLIVLQAQLWRGFWLVQVLAVVAVVDLASRYLIRSRAPHREQLALAILLALIAREHLGWLLLSAFLALRLGAGGYLRTMLHRTDHLKKPTLGICAVLALMLLPGYWSSLSLLYASADPAQGAYGDIAANLLLSGGFGLVPVCCWWLLLRWRRGLPGAALSLAAGVLLILAAMGWDSRSADIRYQESRYVAGGEGRMFNGRIAPGDVVYWHRNLERVWFELGTAAYAGAAQASGQVFSRQRVELLEARLARILTASLDAEGIRAAERGEWNPGDALKAGDPRLLGVAPEALISYERLNLSSEAGIRHVCRDTELAYLISSYRITGAVLAEDSETFAGRKRLSHYLYSCEALRGQQSGDGR